MIFGRHSVLKRGCSTWDRQQMPQEEYQGRLESLRQQMAQQGLDALVIYGDNYSYADLCYLTNYFPKVRGGIGIIPRERTHIAAVEYRQSRCSLRQESHLG